VRLKSVLELPEQHRAEARRQLAGNPPQAIILQRSPRDPSAVLAVKVTKPSKFRNVRVVLDGESYDSRLEYEFHQVLKRRQQAGEIGLLLRQVPFRLEGGVVYKADFVATTNVAPHFCEVWDAKGCDTRSSINKRKQVLARYGIEVLLHRKPTRGER
jgi:hypothetical protein